MSDKNKCNVDADRAFCETINCVGFNRQDVPLKTEMSEVTHPSIYVSVCLSSPSVLRWLIIILHDMRYARLIM